MAENQNTLKYVSLITLTLQNAALALSMRHARSRRPAEELFISSTGRCLFSSTRVWFDWSLNELTFINMFSRNSRRHGGNRQTDHMSCAGLPRRREKFRQICWRSASNDHQESHRYNKNLRSVADLRHSEQFIVRVRIEFGRCNESGLSNFVCPSLAALTTLVSLFASFRSVINWRS